MKLHLIILTAALLITSYSSGQQNKFTIGLAAGGTSSSYHGFERFQGIEPRPLMAISAGLSLQYNLPRVFAISSGISYEVKGERLKGKIIHSNGLTTDYTETHNLAYLTVPLLLRANFGKKIIFSAEAGGFIAYRMQAYTIVSGIPVNETKGDVSHYYERMDAGVAFGLGAAVPLGDKLLLSLNVRNSLGLMDISTLPTYNDQPIKTNSMSLLLGLSYKLGKRSV